MAPRDHTVLAATLTFIHTISGKWNEPYLPLLPSRGASPLCPVRYSFFRAAKGRRLSWPYSGWLQTEVV